VPDNVQELNYNFWTSMSRRGCIASIKKCFYNQTKQIASYPEYDTYFWRMFDKTDTGACVALQTLPFGMDQTFEEKKLVRYAIGPVFENCKALNYFACEVEGRRSKYVAETELVVNQQYF